MPFVDSLLPASPLPGPPQVASPDFEAVRARRRAIGVRPGQSVAITYGTYDLFHVGHLRLFQRIKQRCGFLIVAVSTDRFNAAKGKVSVVPFADRLEIVRACRWVDHAIAEDGWDQKERDLAEYGVDLFAMGDDWAGKFDHLAAWCDVSYLPRTEGVSSTDLKRHIRGATP
jgi:glycerol-3-phosphate cytidylyltransferase